MRKTASTEEQVAHALRQQREGLDVVASDTAQEVLEADVDKRLHPLDGVVGRGRHHGLPQEGLQRLGKRSTFAWIPAAVVPRISGLKLVTRRIDS